MTYHSRGFLNEKHGLAAFEAEIEKPSRAGFSADFSITDCGRKITLDFSVYYDGYSRAGEDFRKGLSKLDTLMSELQKFRDAIVLAESEVHKIPPGQMVEIATK